MENYLQNIEIADFIQQKVRMRIIPDGSQMMKVFLNRPVRYFLN